MLKSLVTDKSTMRSAELVKSHGTSAAMAAWAAVVCAATAAAMFLGAAMTAMAAMTACFDGFFDITEFTFAGKIASVC